MTTNPVRINFTAIDVTDPWLSLILAVEARAAYLKAAIQIRIETPWLWPAGVPEHPYFQSALDLATASGRVAGQTGRELSLLSGVDALANRYWRQVFTRPKAPTPIDQNNSAEA